MVHPGSHEFNGHCAMMKMRDERALEKLQIDDSKRVMGFKTIVAIFGSVSIGALIAGVGGS